jgi:hypothetical protein
MPFDIISTSKGWYVVKEEGGKKIRMNKDPYPSHDAAVPYLRALYAHSEDSGANKNKKK